jgi:uncharacterized protein YjiS (DUF1127 family)
VWRQVPEISDAVATFVNLPVSSVACVCSPKRRNAFQVNLFRTVAADRAGARGRPYGGSPRWQIDETLLTMAAAATTVSLLLLRLRNNQMAWRQSPATRRGLTTLSDRQRRGTRGIPAVGDDLFRMSNTRYAIRNVPALNTLRAVSATRGARYRPAEVMAGGLHR